MSLGLSKDMKNIIFLDKQIFDDPLIVEYK